MELVEQTKSWIDEIQHCVSFDSWTQFIHYGEGLRCNWSPLVMLSWGCKVEKNAFLLQIVYLDLYGQRQKQKEILPAFKSHRFEMKTVEIGIKESDVEDVKKWLVEQNPDLWKMRFLCSKSSP